MSNLELPPASDGEKAAEAEAWAQLMYGNLEGLLAFIRAGHPIRPESEIAIFLTESLAGTGDFKLQLVTRGRGSRPWMKRADAMDRRVRIGWFIEARLGRGLRFDDVIADAVKEYGIGRKSAEAELTFFRKCWDKCECKEGQEPAPVTDPELLEFLGSWGDILAQFPNG